MATYKGVVQTAIDAGGLSNFQAAGIIDGRVKVRSDYRTMLATEVAGSVLEFGGDLPAGAKILAIILSSSVAQSSLTISVGTSYNADEFVAAGATTLQTALTALVCPGAGYVVGTSTADSQITVTTAAATATAGIIYCQILYTTD